MTTQDTYDSIAKYYDRKTKQIIEKYGPGPIIHYHTGLYAQQKKYDSIKDIQYEMHKAQDNVLAMIIDNICMPLPDNSIFLDVGCGLGGGSFYLAKAINTNVLGITIANEHIIVLNRLKKELQIKRQVRFELLDATEIKYVEMFDGAIAIESPCYMDRMLFFKSMSKTLKKGARLHIFDWEKKNDNDITKIVDWHWKTEMGTISEYDIAAKKFNFVKVKEEILNDDTLQFWEIANQWNELSLSANSISNLEVIRLEESKKCISALIDGFRNYEIMSVYQIYQKE